MSFEKLAKENIKKLYPEAYVDSHFAKRLKGAYIESFYENPHERLHVIPDCYFHFWQPKDDAEGGVDYFIICEVEDTNPLTKNKLGLYGRLWDMAYNNLEVWSFNRYGQFTTSHNLSYWYFYWLNYSWQETPTFDEEALNKQLSSIHINVREPIFPGNEKFIKPYESCNLKPASKLLGMHNGKEIWCQERRLRLFKNLQNRKDGNKEWDQAEKYWQKHGEFPAGYEEKYGHEVCSYEEIDGQLKCMGHL